MNHESKRLLWISENEKYKVLVRKFQDNSIDIGFWKLDENGRNQDVRFKSLPGYVKAKIAEMKREVS